MSVDFLNFPPNWTQTSQTSPTEVCQSHQSPLPRDGADLDGDSSAAHLYLALGGGRTFVVGGVSVRLGARRRAFFFGRERPRAVRGCSLTGLSEKGPLSLCWYDRNLEREGAVELITSVTPIGTCFWSARRCSIVFV